MQTYVALMYSIVIAPGRRVIMADLRDLAGALDLARPRTVLATGNLVFESAETDPRALESRLEDAFATQAGRRIDFIVRPGEDWGALVAANPFPEASRTDAGHVVVRVMRQPLDEGVLATLAPYAVPGEEMAVRGGDLWVYFAHGIGRSRLAAAITPKRAGIGTSRNWNTVLKIGDML